MGKKYEMDMTTGPMLKKLILFTVPLILSGILQLAFNAVDVIVVGKCVDETALAAVGSTGSLINLLLGLFNGLAVGTNVLVARYYGAGQEKDLREIIHTSVTLGLCFGILLAGIGFFFARTFLTWMGSPEDVIDQATTYLRIYFLGVPFSLVYNYSAAALRAVGDTKRPLYFLVIAGVTNLLLNLFFVLVVGIGVAGVAIATVVSQAVSCVLVLNCLLRSDSAVRLRLSELKITVKRLPEILTIGLPAGLQGIMFAFSNVLIQSSINSFGSLAMAGNTAAQNVEGFVYTAMFSFQNTNVSFISQNVGARKLNNVWKIAFLCLLLTSSVGLIFGTLVYQNGPAILRVYTDSEEAIRYGMIRMYYMGRIYFLCGIMDTMVGALRGIGTSLIPMIVSLMGSCVFRVVWIMTYFQSHRTLDQLYLSYPISWILTGTVHIICFIILFRRLRRQLCPEEKH